MLQGASALDEEAENLLKFKKLQEKKMKKKGIFNYVTPNRLDRDLIKKLSHMVLKLKNNQKKPQHNKS